MTLATLAIGRGLADGVAASTPSPVAPTADWAPAGHGRVGVDPSTWTPAATWVACARGTVRVTLSAAGAAAIASAMRAQAFSTDRKYRYAFSHHREAARGRHVSTNLALRKTPVSLYESRRSEERRV